MTKAAPLADLDVLTRTYQAVGLDFLRKLLLPLQEVRAVRVDGHGRGLETMMGPAHGRSC